MSDEDAWSFIDTNVLLYAYDASAGQRHDRAARLVDSLAMQHQAATSVQVLQEFYVNATRKIAGPLRPDIALDRIRAFSRWPTHAPTAHDVIAAATLAHTAKLSLWDAMIVHSAAELGCAVLWSEDLNAGQRISGVEVRNPFAGSS